VKWSDSGDSLIITDINTFSDQILPEYFNHNNYSSFIRQLNMYGFRKENKEKKSRQEEYKNEFFRKGRKDLLSQIVRKRRGEEEEDAKLGRTVAIPANRGRVSTFGFSEADLKMIKPEMIQEVAQILHSMRK
jgi:HSF-type DNA-binding